MYLHVFISIQFIRMPNSGEETTLIWHVQPGQDANGAAAEALRRLLAGFLSAGDE